MPGNAPKSPRNAPLAEAKAAARDLAEELHRHRKQCTHCSRYERDRSAGKCPERTRMSAELRVMRAEIRDWFKPQADDAKLF
jgi:hypothetical protein